MLLHVGRRGESIAFEMFNLKVFFMLISENNAGFFFFSPISVLMAT